MDRDSADLLLMGAADKPPPLRIHAIERELHTIASAAGRMANALERIVPKLEGIAKDIAVLRSLVEREAANGSREHGPGTPHDRLQRP